MQVIHAPALLVRFLRLISLTALIALGLAYPASSLHAELLHGEDATANESAPTGLDPALEQQVRALALSGAAPAGVVRREVVLGQIDSRLHLAPCQRVEPYVPNGTRLWGKSRIGLRCAKGPTPWNIYLPITVKAFGPALVATSGATAGNTLSAADLSVGEVDLAEDAAPALVDPSQAIGRTFAVTLKPGQSVRQGHFKAKLLFAAGDTVKVVASGQGFSLESEGQALSNGIEGQVSRVRTESGRILTGVPSGERRLELNL